MAYDFSSYGSRSYGYWDGNRMVSGFESPNSSFRIGMENGSYYDPWTLYPRSYSSMNLGMRLRF